jgi:hypothetical protein
MRSYFLSAVLVALLCYADTTCADANAGDLFGYSLGSRYTESPIRAVQPGQLSLLSTQNPIKPESVEQVFVLVTPVSHSIGKIAGETWYQSGEDALVAYELFRVILRKKYSDWESDETAQQNIHSSRFWSGDYELEVRVSGPHRDNPLMPPDKTFQLLIALTYKPSTTTAVEFEALAKAEIKQSAAGTFSEDEARGL